MKKKSGLLGLVAMTAVAMTMAGCKCTSCMKHPDGCACEQCSMSASQHPAGCTCDMCAKK